MLSISDIHTSFLRCKGVSTDSRKVSPSSFFVAIRGEKFDGNDYVHQALSQGAKYCLVDRETLKDLPGCLYVPNTLVALQRLAAYHRSRFDIPVLALTGSNGKTTTKELINIVLSAKYRVLCTNGNFNNHLGVPLTILRITDDHELAVIEMGANHGGEINWLCQIAQPTIGIITNIGNAHLEGFGSLQGIRDGKHELYRYLDTHSGLIFANGEELSMSDFKTYGYRNAVSFNRDKITGTLRHINFVKDNKWCTLDLVTKEGDVLRTHTNLYGEYNLQNIFAAACIGSWFGVDPEKICENLVTYQSSNNRTQLIEQNGNVYYLDAYNANPTSVTNALNFFMSIEGENKMIVLGDMLELGAEEDEYHRTIIDSLDTSKVSKVLLAGPIYNRVCHQRTIDDNVLTFDSSDSLISWLKKNPFKNAQILVKGSRGMRLEKILTQAI